MRSPEIILFVIVYVNTILKTFPKVLTPGEQE